MSHLLGVKASALLVIFLMCGLVFVPFAPAQDHDVVLRAEFSVDLAPPPHVSAFSGVVDPAYVARLPDGEAAAALLSEARWAFGGMIWGFDYVYTPSDRSRGILELFELKPRWSDTIDKMELKPVSARLDGTVLLAGVECYPTQEQRRELASWKLVSAAEQGTGSAPAFGIDSNYLAQSAIEAKRDAVNVAVKEALRSYLRELTHNKPREVRGSCAFAQVPRLFIRGGQWVAIVRIYSRVDEIVQYGAY